MKRCPSCKEDLPEKAYYPSTFRTTYGSCISCLNRRYEALKDRAYLTLGDRCFVCGYDRTRLALDFHHLDPSKKEFSVTKLAKWSWRKMEKELRKCLLLCARCHREVHAGLVKLPDSQEGQVATDGGTDS